MLKITHQTPTRLVLRDDRRGLRLLAVVFTALSVLSVLMLVALAVQRFTSDPFISLIENRLVALLVFVVVGVGFVGLGLYTLLNVSHGITVTFDKVSETVTTHRARGVRSVKVQQSIYGVSGLAVERNDEMSLYGLYLVLRSGEQIPLATLPQHEQDTVDQMVRVVRQFLRG